MVDANEKDEAPESNLSPEKYELVIPPSSVLNNMEEEDDDEEEYEYEEDEDEEEEEEEDENEEEKVNEQETKKETSVKEDEKKSKEPRKDEKLGESSKSKEKKPKPKELDKSTKKSVVNGDKKPESSSKKRGSKRVESMGMVFMCSSKTKKDCFRYKILGLPANKQDQVAKIYKGMRLFLFDVELRLMYGIFKAAGPGGYNIEPKAFKSEFPSQVRFTVLDDCLPVAEESFKDVLKENYYTRNKFEGLLKADQVKKLCKLFAVTSKGSLRSKSDPKPRRLRPIENHRERRREDESRDRKKRKIHAREDERPRAHPRHRSRSPPRREERRYPDYEPPRVVYERAPPVVRYLPPPQLPVVRSPGRSYAYDRPVDIHAVYDRVRDVDRVPDHRGYRGDREVERDPYYVYTRDAPGVYALPPEYHIVSREYHHPPPVVQQPPPPEYRVHGYRDVGPAIDYRSSPPRALPEYRGPRTHYRY